MPREKSTGPTSDFRKQQLAIAARSIVERVGMNHIYEGGKLLPMAKIMMGETGCSVDTAKRHLAKQLRLMRGEIVAERGGARDGAGRPVNEKGNK